MPAETELLAEIANAADQFAPYWPLTGFIATNPLQGFERLPFESAVDTATALFGGSGYPSAAMISQARGAGWIDPDVLRRTADQQGCPTLPSVCEPDAGEPNGADVAGAADPINVLMIKWLSAFLDEGQAAWTMPGRERGFYRAFRLVAVYDPALPAPDRLGRLPDDALKAVARLTEPIADGAQREALFTDALAALPGWTSHVKWRSADRLHRWRQAAPISLVDYVAVRLALADQFGVPVCSGSVPAPKQPETGLWLEAWEETYRERLARALAGVDRQRAATQAPEAQIVFCIDVRSEVFRRHLERAGPYQTFGFGGFFGAPIAVLPWGADYPQAACPVLIDPAQTVAEGPAPGAEALADRHRSGRARLSGLKRLVRDLKDSVAGCFAFVESTGALFGAAMVARTMAPHRFGSALRLARQRLMPDVPLAPRLDLEPEAGRPGGCGPSGPMGLSETEKLAFAEGLLTIMGLTRDFAPLVVLTGHGGQTVNNPFEAGLDCGACAGHRGGPNARIMAAVLNDPAVRRRLAERGITIPAGTVFVAAEHNTTTDVVTLYDSPEARTRHGTTIDRLIRSLEAARSATVAERVGRLPGGRPQRGVVAAEERALDWAQTRPEWGLARNAAFIIGPRDMTCALDLEGRTFLHSYDWRGDPTGKALEVILTAPMVVAQWINSQYYFSTVDNAVYGAGSKVTHTVVGAFGVMQGNAGDLMTGLPAQSVMDADGRPYHQPLRLLTVVEAPLDRVTGIIARNAILETLFDNGWVALLVCDPETGRQSRRERDGQWRPALPEAPVSHPTEDRQAAASAPPPTMSPIAREPAQ